MSLDPTWAGATYTVNCSMMFHDVPLAARPAAARAAGFEAVEFWWPFDRADPDRHEIDSFVDSIVSAGVMLQGLNLFAGDLGSGDRGILSHPGRLPELMSSLRVAREIGERLGTQAFNALYGNRLEGVDAAYQDSLALLNLEVAAKEVGEIGGVILIEPLSGAPAYPLSISEDVTRVMRQLEQRDVRNVRLLADLYHLANNGEDIDRLITSQASLFGHVQIADSPGRGAPGTGQLPLARWVDAAYGAGYSGRIGLEYQTSFADFSWMEHAARNGPHRSAWPA